MFMPYDLAVRHVTQIFRSCDLMISKGELIAAYRMIPRSIYGRSYPGMSLRHLIIAYILACLLAVAAPAQEQKTENPPEPEAHGTRLHWQDIPRNVLHDQKAIFTSPLHINRENAKWWILFAAATGTLIANDQRISD